MLLLTTVTSRRICDLCFKQLALFELREGNPIGYVSVYMCEECWNKIKDKELVVRKNG